MWQIGCVKCLAKHFTHPMCSATRLRSPCSAKRSPTATFSQWNMLGLTGLYDTVWYRRSGRAMCPPGMRKSDWTMAARECNHHIRTLRRYLAPDAYWINDIVARERVAARSRRPAGLAIPHSLVSNDPTEIRLFYAEHRRRSIVLQVGRPNASARAESSGERHVLTTQLRDEHLGDDEALSSCPAIYQSKIDKQYELRVTCMDQRCFTVQLDSQSNAGTRLDWRTDFARS